MKNYNKVIEERYDKQKYDGRGIKKNVYSLFNPIGFYSEFKSAQILLNFVRMCHKSLDKINVCDCGCGDGVKTRFLAELLGNPKQIYGIEYSQNRLQHCIDMNPNIHYKYADLTKKGEGIPFDIQFDGIIAFVVFMHFDLEEDIMNALKNIYDSLKKKGLFLWYEANADSHKDGKTKNIDHWGFSTEEMDKYASNVGFTLIKQFGIYTQIPIINKATVYLPENINNIWVLELMEKLPFKKIII